MKTLWTLGRNAGLLAVVGTLLSAGSARGQLLDVTQTVYGMD